MLRGINAIARSEPVAGSLVGLVTLLAGLFVFFGKDSQKNIKEIEMIQWTQALAFENLYEDLAPASLFKQKV